MRPCALFARLPVPWLFLLGLALLFGPADVASAQRRRSTCYVVTNRCCAELQQCRQKVLHLEKHIARLKSELACCHEAKTEQAEQLDKCARMLDDAQQEIRASRAHRVL